MFAVAVPMAAVLLIYTGSQVGVLEAGYQITPLEDELYELEQAERRLRLEASRLTRAARIEDVAVSQLGMVTPQIEQMVFVGEEP